MPAKTTIFNAKAEPTHTFPLGPRNTIIFSPHGRFVIVAGFGNLAGQMDIYDLSKNYNKVCTVEASNTSVCEWSPDGSHILCATTSPRLRVDNGIRLYHVGGGLMYFEEVPAPNELYHVCWRPQSTTLHPLPADPLNPVPTPHASALAYLATKKPATKPAGAYRPPGARGTSTPLHFKREDEGGAAYNANGISSTSGTSNGFGKQRRGYVPGSELVEPPLPPGAAPGGGVSLSGTGEGADDKLSKAALKNKKKREAKKARDSEKEKLGVEKEGFEGVPKGPRAMSRSPERRAHHQRNRSGFERSHSDSPHRRDRSRPRPSPNGTSRLGQNTPVIPPPSRPSPPLAVDTAPSKGPPPDLTVTSPGGDAKDKKVRGLLKKIRAIEELKMRQASGEKLEATQVKKIATEESVRRELDAMGAQ
jgi:translation initiation factor 2A